jgi:putative endonuclease
MENKRPDKKKLGSEGEMLGLEYLIGQGYKLLERNWRCRTGELDMIMERDDTVVIVEVRTRRSSAAFGTPAESVDARKQRKLVETAHVYSLMRKLDKQLRFDVIAIQFDKAGRHELQHIENAF